MSVLYIALPIAVGLGGLGLWACVRSIQSGQYDDLESPPMRMLIDDVQNPADDASKRS